MNMEFVGNLSTIRSEFKWVISNFSDISCKNVGEFLDSPKFTTKYNSENIQWFLRLYPKGRTYDSKECLSIYICCDSLKNIKAVVTFIDLNNKDKHIINRTMSQVLFDESTAAWGFDKFISQAFVKNPENDVLDNGKLKIMCKIKLCENNEIRSSIECGNVSEIEEVEDYISPRLEDKYEALFNDGKFSDLTLISEGKSIHVHWCILANASEVFSSMFVNKTRPKPENIIEIPGIKYNVLLEILRFIYAGKINNINTIARELTIAADKYAVRGLKDVCERKMLNNLRCNNVIDYLQLANNLRMNKLKQKAIEFIVENRNDI